MALSTGGLRAVATPRRGREPGGVDLRPIFLLATEARSTSELRGLGVSKRELRKAVLSHSLERVRRGAYGLPGNSAQLCALQRTTRAVVSHTTAAKLLGIGLVFDDPLTHVTWPRAYGRSGDAWVTSHWADIAEPDVTFVAGLRCTGAVRTVLDLAATLPLEQAVAAADSALRAGLTTTAELTAAVDALPPKRPGVRLLRRVLGLLDPSSGSVLESILRVLLVLNGLAPPETQYVIRSADGAYIVRADFAWPDLLVVVEADGFEHHGSDVGRWRKDLARANLMTLAGWRLLRFSWDEVLHRPDLVVSQVRALVSAH